MAAVSLDEAIGAATEHHRAGRLAEAEAIYRQVLAVDPNHADALHLLGLIAQQAGRRELAVELISRAIALRGDQAYANLGSILGRLGRDQEAVAAHRKAIALAPNHAVVRCNLGAALHGINEIDEAILQYERAIALKPDYAEAYSNLGNALKDKQD